MTAGRYSKYRNTRTEYNGKIYDSKFEAGVAAELDLRKRANDILDWEPQFKIDMWAYNASGKKVMNKTHRIDFRVHELDGTFTLLEAKGHETADYKDRRKWLEKLWLPEHLDHTYQVVKKSGARARRITKGI